MLFDTKRSYAHVHSVYASQWSGGLTFLRRFKRKFYRFQVKVLYVRNLTQDITEEALKDEFERFGAVERVKKIKDYAFVHFDDRDSAVKVCIQQSHKQPHTQISFFSHFNSPHTLGFLLQSHKQTHTLEFLL